MQETTLVYLLFDGIGPPCPGLKKHLSWMGELWLNGDGGEGMWVAQETKGLNKSTGSITVCKREVF